MTRNLAPRINAACGPSSSLIPVRRVAGESPVQHMDVISAMQAWKQEVEDRLASYRLTIHLGKHTRLTNEGFPFLGFTDYPYRR